jgi:hypothetical protein
MLRRKVIIGSLLILVIIFMLVLYFAPRQSNIGARFTGFTNGPSNERLALFDITNSSKSPIWLITCRYDHANIILTNFYNVNAGSSDTMMIPLNHDRSKSSPVRFTFGRLPTPFEFIQAMFLHLLNPSALDEVPESVISCDIPAER